MTGHKRIRIGNQTAFSAPLMDPFEFAVATGFDAFEWFPDKKTDGSGWSEDELSKEVRSFIRKTASERDIALALHAPWQTNPLRPESVERLYASCDLASDIGASILNIHLYREQGVRAFLDSIIPVVIRLSTLGIRLSIENTAETGPDDFNAFFTCLADLYPVYSDTVGICLDIGHANICAATRNNYLGFIDLLDRTIPIIHVHMHENYGDLDSHLPLFTGPSASDHTGITGLIERLMDRDYSGSIILEQWPQPPGLLTEARARLLAIIGRPAPALPREDAAFVAMIAEADRRFRSWRRKLEWVRDLVQRHGEGLTTDQLVYIAVYLRFIGTGRVRCIEDGGHYRPSRHAKAAEEIYRRLERVTTHENAPVIRKILPWLPSFTGSFMKAEPLTRIRDIAHRNDIPRELKLEIKTTLQNKLHRSAGPEDLFVSEAILAKITAPDAAYSQAFVGEFRKFHEELKEFFNARSLDEELKGMAVRPDGPGPRLIKEFLKARAQKGGCDAMLEALRRLTALREFFHIRTEGEAASYSHRRLIADTKLEESGFVLLSETINCLDGLADDEYWKNGPIAVRLAAANLRLSGIETDECRAIETDIEAWAEDFDHSSQDDLLRLYSTIERCRRLAEGYCSGILALFAEKAGRLGRALGVDEHAVSVYAESEIRSSIAFQLSKLVSSIGGRIRQLAGLSPWESVVQGEAGGTLRTVRLLGDLYAEQDGPTVAFVGHIEGDEEIPASVSAVITSEETPFLSHLAVRARQKGVVFVVCHDRQLLEELITPLVRQMVALSADSRDVTIKRSEGADGRTAAHGPVSLPEVVFSQTKDAVALSDVTVGTGGGKAFAARRLEMLAKDEAAGFFTPKSLVIPFGVMEDALRAAPDLEKKYYGTIGMLKDHDDYEARISGPTGIIRGLDISHKMLADVKHFFGHDARLIVRSTSNTEDLAAFSGAGLYDSISNVSPSGLQDAVRSVWASLWNRRAVMSRQQAGIDQGAVHMAVLIQEMISPDYSFIMHTLNPSGDDRDEVYIELAVGLGETLASATPGTACRMVWNRRTGEARTLSFPSFSRTAAPGKDGGITHTVVTYSKVGLVTDKRLRETLACRIGKIGAFLEGSFGAPQDIEGLVAGDKIYIVQSRPQLLKTT